MGFKKIRDFNIAMLGRQGWRLLKFEESLVGRVFKARYYPNGTFVEAKLGNNLSYVWRSILEAQTLIKRGARWRVGDGSCIEVVGQPWLPDAQMPLVTSTHPALYGTKVMSIMSQDGKCWEGDIIENLFNDQDKALIYNVPISHTKRKDTWYWMFDLKGNYSVKDGYKQIQIMNNRWEESDSSSTWQKLWKLNVPAKVKTFLWRGLTNCLPTRVNLR